MLCKCGKEMNSIHSHETVERRNDFDTWYCRGCRRIVMINEKGDKQWVEMAAKPLTMFDPAIV